MRPCFLHLGGLDPLRGSRSLGGKGAAPWFWTGRSITIGGRSGLRCSCLLRLDDRLQQPCVVDRRGYRCGRSDKIAHNLLKVGPFG